ncbi:putative lipoprotein [Segatella baroniae F0067]|uniref:Putative lipoprotein n=1 Tax=Segatella baroniae F0067 TaxID=1115809 RepID=U2QB36_9BACT|nr:putative lipoprotein [Segatella baroniae F0067]
MRFDLSEHAEQRLKGLLLPCNGSAFSCLKDCFCFVKG